MRVASTLMLFVLAVLAVSVSGQVCTNPTLGPGQDVGGCTAAIDGMGCDLTCLPGLTQQGNLTLICVAGTWNYSIATGVCVAPCASDYPSGANVSPGTCLAGTPHGTMCTVNCTAGAGTAVVANLNTMCNNGTFVPVVPGTCALCPNGTYNDVIGPTCMNCPSLAISIGGVGGVGGTSCTCQGGAYINNPSPLTCLPCSLITGCFGVTCTAPGASTCATCLPGWTGSGSSTCTMCQANQYCIDSSCSTCVSCNGGSTSPPASPSGSSCVCLPGYSTDGSIPPFCSICTNGYYEVNHVCQPCDSGFNAGDYSPQGATSASQCICDAGYGLAGTPAPALCRPCNNNEYGSPGSGVCRPCPAFSTGAGTRSTQCYCNSGYVESFDVNGVQTCNRIFYNWQTGEYGACSGTCGEGDARRRGYQVRSVYCVNNATGDIEPEYFCQTTRPDTSRPCDRTCPAMPTGVAATPYFESALVTWNIPSQNYTNMGPCVNGGCPDGGVCDNSTTPNGAFICRLDTNGWVIMSDPDDIYVYTRSGRTNGMQGALVKGLTNGRRYTFTVRLVTFPVYDSFTGVTAPLQSEASTPSNLVLVASTLSCFGGCTANGRCIGGECVCDPGFTGPSCSTAASLNFNITTGLIYDRVQGPLFTGVITVMPMDLPVDLKLYEAKCKTLDWCVPVMESRDNVFVNGIGTVNSASWNVPAGQYFGRVYVSNRNDFHADTEIFTITDHYCESNPCLNQATCIAGGCECALGFTGARCEIQIDPCTQIGLDCSGPYSSGCNFATRECMCILGWHGDQCQYPPTWNLDCKNHGLPNDPTNAADVEVCNCPAPWTGVDCSNCEIDCLNGGTSLGCDAASKTLITSPPFEMFCKCPALFDGPVCQYPYVTAYITLQGTNNLNDDNEDDFVTMVTRDIVESLDLSTNNYFRIYQPVEHSSSSAKVEIRFYEQQPNNNPSSVESGVAIRNRFIDAVNDPNSHFHVQTVSGDVTGTSASITNPDQSIPDKYSGSSDDDQLVLKTVLPIVLGLLFIIIMIVIIRKYCCNGSSSDQRTHEMTDTSGQAARS